MTLYEEIDASVAEMLWIFPQLAGTARTSLRALLDQITMEFRAEGFNDIQVAIATVLKVRLELERKMAWIGPDNLTYLAACVVWEMAK